MRTCCRLREPTSRWIRVLCSTAAIGARAEGAEQQRDVIEARVTSCTVHTTSATGDTLATCLSPLHAAGQAVAEIGSNPAIFNIFTAS